MRFSTSIIALLAGLAPSALAILVAKGSSCSPKCGNELSSTAEDDLVCDEGAYDASGGTVFKNCLNCELHSTYQRPSTEYENNADTDTQWALYNLRYATSVCLFGFGGDAPPSNPCLTSTACEPFKEPVEFAEMQTNVSTYDYCTTWDHVQLPKCIACLRAGQSHYISNFLSILGAGCTQQPVPGTLVGFEGDPFSQDRVNETDSGLLPTLPADYFKEGPFGLGAKVGVAFGALALLLLVAGLVIVCVGRRRRKNYLKRYEARHGKKNWAGMVAPPTRDMHDTPLSQRPLRGWDDTPMSAVTDGTMTEKGGPYQRYFSPYSSQYNSPVSAATEQQAAHVQWPSEKAMMTPPGGAPNPSYLGTGGGGRPQEIGLALGGSIDGNTTHFSDPISPSKGKQREQYEMHDVDVSDRSYPVSLKGSSGGGYDSDGYDVKALPDIPQPPVLHHPGYGRSNESLPRRYPANGAF